MEGVDGEQGDPDGSAGEGAEEKDGSDGIGPHGVFGAEVVDAEKKRGQQGGDDPVHR